MQRLRPFALLFLILLSVPALPARQANPGQMRQIPPVGIEIPAADRAELEAGLVELAAKIDSLRTTLKDKPSLLALLPDVQIYKNAVRYPLKYNEFYKPEEVKTAKALLKQGLERAQALAEGKAPWTTQTGLVARGYESEIDGSIQPYGLVVPATWRADLPHQYRLDVWLHGRGENLTELNFIADRQKNPGQFTPPNTIVLHPYGRYCNANKLAGEIDVLESMAAVRKHYAIDENRISIRGFSMGGAGTWIMATHHAGLWAAAAPGAGFAETPEYLRLTEKNMPAWYEQKLWHCYNATDYALNLFNLPTVAYTGELDRQKQAAEVMARELKKEGIDLVHISGPKTEHKYHPDSIVEINRRIDAIVALGRNPVPRQVKFTTWTLRYNKMLWVTVDALDRHWERARVDAEIQNETSLAIKTSNVSGLSIEFPPGRSPFDATRKPTILLDEQKLLGPSIASDRSWTAHFRRQNGGWTLVNQVETETPAKRHGLQGPIDDAFMSSFVIVRPTGAALNEQIGSWVTAERQRAEAQWRSQFRGEPRVKNDTEITDADIAAHNLILWGDPSSNALLAKIVDRLPIQWNAREIKVGAQSYPANVHAPVLIYPNPLNPKRYIVINSGFSFREADYLTNSRQTPRLPDWAVIDLRVPPDIHLPGRIADAGFFGERWELTAAR